MRRNTGSVVFTLLIVTALSLVGGHYAVAQTPQVRGPKPAQAELASYARSASALGFSGTLLVARGSEILLHDGYGWANQSEQTRNDTNTVFYIASLSKQFTAAAVLLLEAQGKLKTTDRINLYLDDVPSDKSNITLHDLLTHTSGLQRFGWDEATNDWRKMGRDEAIRGILSSRLSHAPGQKYSYQNANYILLAAIIEKVSGTSYQAFVRDELLRRAEVKSGFFGIESAPAAAAIQKVAMGYSDGELIGSYFDRPKTWLRAGGGDMLFTVGDLFRWHVALRQGKVLPKAQLDKLFSTQVTIEPGLGYSYGWEIRQSTGGNRVIFHRGDFTGYHCEFRWYPESDVTLIVATNNDFHGTSITESMLNAIAAILKGQSSPLPPVVDLNEAQLNRYSGSYQVPGGGWLQVSPSRGKLDLEAAGPRAADILANADAGGAKERELYGERTINLIDRLKHAQQTAYAEVLAPQVLAAKQEFDAEWNSLGTRLGGLRSYQILSTVYRAEDHAWVSYVNLNFDRGRTVMGYAWKGDKLQYTLPGARPEPGRVAFVPLSANTFLSFDWRSGQSFRITFENDQTGFVTGLKFEGPGTTNNLTRARPSTLESKR